MKVAMIGHGWVGTVHASQLASERGVELVAVFSPERKKALEFASAHSIKHVSATLAEAVSLAEAVIVCSPSALHYQQARECLELGVHTLVEMPACETMKQADILAEVAQKQGVRVQCAHTSRYFDSYIRIGNSIRSGELGPVQEVNYVRLHKLLKRAWTDDALLHHAMHPVDLMMDWFGGITPKGCVALPQARGAQTVSLLGKLPHGAPAAVSVTFASRLTPVTDVRMLVVGKRHTVETDGFSYVRSDLEHLRSDTAGQANYERAIHNQDVAFLHACQGERTGVDWQETVKLMGIINHFQELGDR